MSPIPDPLQDADPQHLAVMLAHAGRCQDLAGRMAPLVRSPISAALVNAIVEIGKDPAGQTAASTLRAIRRHCPMAVPVEQVVRAVTITTGATGLTTEANGAPPAPTSAAVSATPISASSDSSTLVRTKTALHPEEVETIQRQEAYLRAQQRRMETSITQVLSNPPSVYLIGRIRDQVERVAAAQSLEKARVKTHQLSHSMYNKDKIDFNGLRAAAAPRILAICKHLLPGGEVRGNEYVALNPMREDRHLGSFRIELAGEHAGRWNDWAMEDIHGDIVDLIAYLRGESKGRAAASLKTMLGIKDHPEP